jgi:NAD(P)-dependent dehydrogenase (short-subunit alcohol dehydrogenase family)
MNNPLEMFSLSGKTALITGSTRGIGAAIARGFAAAGARVWIHGREVEEGTALAAELDGTYVRADLAQSTAVRQLAEVISQESESLEVVMPIERIDMFTFELIWKVNVRAAVELTRLLLPLLKRSGASSIINVTSIHQIMPYPHNAAYSMAKAALAMFTKTAAIELAPSSTVSTTSRRARWRRTSTVR